MNTSISDVFQKMLKRLTSVQQKL